MIEEQVTHTEDQEITEEKPVVPSPSAPEPAVEQELEKVKKEMAVLEDRFLRQAADFQNFRKRALEERANSFEVVESRVALSLVNVLDDIRRSLEASNSVEPHQARAAGANSVVALAEGVRLVYEKLESELVKLRVSPMDVVGQPFDENMHEALMQQPAPAGTVPGMVLAEIQKGYMISDKVLRHARVVVAT